MGKVAKSGKAGRNKGDGTTKMRTTQRHREVRIARQTRTLARSRDLRAKHIADLKGLCTRLGAPHQRYAPRTTPSRIKRDLIAFICEPLTDVRSQRSIRLRYGRMTIAQFITHITAKTGG